MYVNFENCIYIGWNFAVSRPTKNLVALSQLFMAVIWSVSAYLCIC